MCRLLQKKKNFQLKVNIYAYFFLYSLAYIFRLKTFKKYIDVL